jgi:hypothetical protein
MNTLIIAKALRTSFNAKQQELLKASWMDDEMILKLMREVQAEYSEFDRITKEMRANDKDSYDNLLGL